MSSPPKKQVKVARNTGGQTATRKKQVTDHVNMFYAQGNKVNEKIKMATVDFFVYGPKAYNANLVSAVINKIAEVKYGSIQQAESVARENQNNAAYFLDVYGVEKDKTPAIGTVRSKLIDTWIPTNVSVPEIVPQSMAPPEVQPSTPLRTPQKSAALPEAVSEPSTAAPSRKRSPEGPLEEEDFGDADEAALDKDEQTRLQAMAPSEGPALSDMDTLQTEQGEGEKEEIKEDENTVSLDPDEISARYSLLRNTISSTTKEVFVLGYLQKRNRGVPVPTHIHFLANRILQLLRGRGILQYTDFPVFVPSGDYDDTEWDEAEAVLNEYLEAEVTQTLYNIWVDEETKEELRDARLILLERLAEEELIAERLLERRLNKERAERAAERDARKAKQAERDAMIKAARAAGKKAATAAVQESGPTIEKQQIQQLTQERDILLDQLPTLGPQFPSTLDPSFRARMMLIYMQQVKAYKEAEVETLEPDTLVRTTAYEEAVNEMLTSIIQAQRIRREIVQQTYLAQVEANLYFGEDDEARLNQQLAEIDGLIEQDIPTDDDFLRDIDTMFKAAQVQAEQLQPESKQALNDSMRLLKEKVTVPTSPDDIDITFTDLEQAQEADTAVATPAATRVEFSQRAKSYTEDVTRFGTKRIGDSGVVTRQEELFKDEPGDISKDERIRQLQQEVNDLRQELARLQGVATEAQQLYDKLFYDMLRIQDVNETARRMDAEYIAKLRKTMSELTPRKPGRSIKPAPVAQTQAATQTWTPLHEIRHREYPVTPKKSQGVTAWTPKKTPSRPIGRIEGAESQQTAATQRSFIPRTPLPLPDPDQPVLQEASPQAFIDNSKALTVRIAQTARNLAVAKRMSPSVSALTTTQDDFLSAQQLYIEQLKNELLKLKGQLNGQQLAIRDIDRPEAQSNFLALEDNRAARAKALQNTVSSTQLALVARRDELTPQGNRDLDRMNAALEAAANDLVKLEKLRLQQLEFYMSLDQERQEQIEALKGAAPKAPSRLAQEAAKRANEEQARNQELRQHMADLQQQMDALRAQQQQPGQDQQLADQLGEEIAELKRRLDAKQAELDAAIAAPKATPKRLRQAIHRANEEQARNQQLLQEIEEVGRKKQEAEAALEAERKRQADKPLTGETPERQQQFTENRQKRIETLETKLARREKAYNEKEKELEQSNRIITELQQSNLDIVNESDRVIARLQADRNTDAQTIRNLMAQTQAQGSTIQFQGQENRQLQQEIQTLNQENIELQANLDKARAEKRQGGLGRATPRDTATPRGGAGGSTPRQPQNNPLSSGMGSRSTQSFTASQRGAGINPVQPSFVGAAPSMTPVFAPNRPQVRDSRDTSNASRFAQKVSRFFETAAPGTNNTTFAFNSYETFLNAMATYGIEAVDLTSDTSYLEEIVTAFYSGTVSRQDLNGIITSARAAGAWPLKYQPKYGDTSITTRSVAFMNRSLGQVVNSDMGTIFVGAQPSSVIRRQGLNYVVSGPRGEKAVFGTARDAQYYSSAKGKRYGPVTESVFGYKPKNLSQAIY